MLCQKGFSPLPTRLCVCHRLFVCLLQTLLKKFIAIAITEADEAIASSDFLKLMGNPAPKRRQPG